MKPIQSITFLLLLILTHSFITASYFEKPPCQDDESAVQIMGVPGSFCSPICATGPDVCPYDVPDGVTAKPDCVLSSPTGENYCALMCSPSLIEEEEGNECGSEMSCQMVADGVGLCTYSDDTPGLEDEVLLLSVFDGPTATVA